MMVPVYAPCYWFVDVAPCLVRRAGLQRHR
jgi:hypothetical protein